MFLGFFILKFLKSKTLLVLLAEAKMVVLAVTLSLKLHNQFGFRACEKFFTNRTVPLLFKCNLLLLRPNTKWSNTLKMVKQHTRL